VKNVSRYRVKQRREVTPC